MLESTPVPPAEATGAEPGYRPISLLAIAGLCLSVFFALVVAVTGLVALFSGKAFRLSEWFLLFAVGGGLLSFVAQWQIRRSEGTRAGMTLATVGLWVSIFFGLGVAAYTWTSHLAIQSQAKRFLLDEFLEKLKSPDQLNAAFLLTQPPDDRPENGELTPELIQTKYSRYYPSFQYSRLVRIAQQGGAETKFSVRSVKKCVPYEGGYVVEVDVNLQTPEVEAQVPFLLHSQENPEGRKWYVDWARRLPEPVGKLTPLGLTLMELRRSSHQVAGRWVTAWTDGNFPDLKKLCCQPEDFAPNGKALVIDPTKVPQEDKRVLLRRLFDPAAKDRPVPQVHLLCCESLGEESPNPILASWEVKNGRLYVTHVLQFRVANKGESEDPRLLRPVGVGLLVLERTDKADPLSYDPNHPPSWCVARLEIQEINVPKNAREAMMKQRGAP